MKPIFTGECSDFTAENPYFALPNPFLLLPNSLHFALPFTADNHLIEISTKLV